MTSEVLRFDDWTDPVLPVEREVVSRGEADGDRPPLLFVPGLGHGAWAFAEHWLPHAAARGFAAHALTPRSGGDLRAHVHDVVQVAASLPRQAVLIGHGVGGLVVANALARYPARAAVLAAPVLDGWATLGMALRVNPFGTLPALVGGKLRLSHRQLFNDPPTTKLSVREESAPSARGESESSGRGEDGSFGRGEDGSFGRGEDGSTGRGEDSSFGRGEDGSTGRRQDGSFARGEGELSRRGESEFSGRDENEFSGRGQSRDGHSPDVSRIERVRPRLELITHRPPARPVGNPPILVAGSPDDRVVPRSSLDRTAARYGGAPLLFPGMGHDLMLDAGWSEPIEAILDWLDKELAATPPV